MYSVTISKMVSITARNVACVRSENWIKEVNEATMRYMYRYMQYRSTGRSKVHVRYMYFVVLSSGMTSFARNIALDQEWIRRKFAGASPF